MKLIPLVFLKENGGRWQKLANFPEDVQEYWREWDLCQDMWLRNKNNIWRLTEPKDKTLESKASALSLYLTVHSEMWVDTEEVTYPYTSKIVFPC